MSLNLGGSEIISVTQRGEKIEILAEGEKKLFDLSQILDVEENLPETDDDVSGVAATLGTIAGFVAGDFTGAIGGGFSGWLAGKLFSKEKIYFLSVVLINNEKITLLLRRV